MEFKQIKYFLEIADQGSFQSAANSLGLTQPALSQQMSLLEREFKEPLFNRSKSGVHLTRKGIVLYQYAIQMKNLWKATEEGMLFDEDELAGHLTIAAGGTVSAWVLPTLIKKVLKDSPKLSISVIEGDNVETKEMLKEGKVDIAIITSPYNPDKSIQTIPFLNDKIVPIVSKNFSKINKKKITIDDLKDEKFVYYHQTSAIRMSLEKSWKKNKIQFQPKILMELRSVDSIVNSVAAGLGIGFISSLALTQKVKVLDCTSLFGEREFLIAHKKNSRKSISLFVSKFLSFQPDFN